MGQVAHTQTEPMDMDGVDAGLVAELEPKLINLMQQSEALVALMRGFFKQLDKRRAEEFRVIAGYISKAKEEIRELRPQDLSQERIPTAGAELEAITRDTEAATHTIMNAAEAIMGMDASDPKAYKAAVDDQVMMIFEACSFQDITGQRVSKVIHVLQQIEERVTKLASALGVEDKAVETLSEREQRARDLLLNGPAIGGPETAQDAIDAMFDAPVAAPTPAAPAAPAPEVKVQAPKVEAPKAAPVAPVVAKAPVAPVAPPRVTPPVPAPVPAPVPSKAESVDNSQDDIDALFDMSPEDLKKTNSQDDIDALFD
ncbi:protein phosphatase CheZ [Asticcacaulis tiandongensis]|uniref:protein phosphatase CheZ n=1 Tax=Asticcacaulis tiandongensis TaxID=2565365 RepID=UPI001125DE91|nr:protein phosphatase CheZ [Asticcacaulis tiandongensis]